MLENGGFIIVSRCRIVSRSPRWEFYDVTADFVGKPVVIRATGPYEDVGNFNQKKPSYILLDLILLFNLPTPLSYE